MSNITFEKSIHTIGTHPNKTAVYGWIRANWHELHDNTLNEYLESVKALSEHIGGSFSFSVGAYPDRGEHLTFAGYDRELLDSLNAAEQPLTGVCCDQTVIEALREGSLKQIIDAIHKDCEYIYSDEYLFDFCDANEYFFELNGTFVSEIEFKVFDIEWDTDGENVTLPNEIRVLCELNNSDKVQFLSDKISDMTGFCHKGFKTFPEIE